jgi:hypothetical protein
MNPRFPIYIPSKGRWESRITARYLEAMGVPYRMIVEAQEYPKYSEVIDREKLLVLDPAYQRDYDPCDGLGLSKPIGSGPARNFAWDHAVDSADEWHWIIDDNISGFYRLNKNFKLPVSDGTPLFCMEDFVLRYKNIAIAGPDYFMFQWRKATCPPFTPNTRIYSCILIRNDIPFRWRCRYNEDTDLSLRVLKAGWCTVLFNAFLQYKMPTQTVRGGNTDTIYVNGTAAKSKMIADLHPDVARVVWKFGRVHHYVDYRPFRKNRLIRRPDIEVPTGTNEYGMKLVVGKRWDKDPKLKPTKKAAFS